MLLAIDSGSAQGWAAFEDRRLVACGFGEPPADLIAGKLDRVLVEVPKFRRGEKNPQSLIVLATRAGDAGGRMRRHVRDGGTVEYLTPNDWKGAVPKDTSHVRILRKLGADEHAAMERGTKRLSIGKALNVMDAIGIGLHGVGRNANANG